MDEDKLSKLQKDLYSKTKKPLMQRVFKLKKEETNIPTDWERNEEAMKIPEEELVYEKTGMSFFSKFFIFSIIFFILSLGAGLYLLFNGSNIVSTDNIDISVSGPTSISAGSELAFDVQVFNKNNIKLELVDLTIEFPSGTVNPDDYSLELKRYKQLMDDISPGGYSQKSIRAVMYGEENAKKEIIIKVEYRTKGSNAVYYKTKTYEVIINSAPVSISIDSFKEIQSGQEIELEVTVTSNSKQLLKNMYIQARYPFGFTLINSDQKTFLNNSTWKIGDLIPQEKKKLVIKGRIEGQENEDRIFTFSTGVHSVKDDRNVFTEFVSSGQTVSIKKPFLSTTLVLGGSRDSTDFISSYNEQITGEIEWFNNLQTAVSDVEIVATFSGPAFDKNSVSSNQGLYRSDQNTITWNSITTNDLRKIEAGGEGKLTFRFTPKLQDSKNPPADPTVNVNINVKAKRLSSTNVPENIKTASSRIVKISSNPNFQARIVRNEGPFTNTGPIPPKANIDTTYTVVWTITNTSSSIGDATVVAKLPSYVNWVGRISPENENITYNKVDGTVTWKAGDVEAFAGSLKPKKEVNFQVSFRPSVTQIGEQLVNLVNDTEFKAIDLFTKNLINYERNELTTRYSTDSSFKNGDEVVNP